MFLVLRLLDSSSFFSMVLAARLALTRKSIRTRDRNPPASGGHHHDHCSWWEWHCHFSEHRSWRADFAVWYPDAPLNGRDNRRCPAAGISGMDVLFKAHNFTWDPSSKTFPGLCNFHCRCPIHGQVSLVCYRCWSGGEWQWVLSVTEVQHEIRQMGSYGDDSPHR